MTGNESTTDEKAMEAIANVAIESERVVEYWKGEARKFRFALNLIIFVAVIISWYFLQAMAFAAASNLDPGDLAYPFLRAAAILVLVYSAWHFIGTVSEIYGDAVINALDKAKGRIGGVAAKIPFIRK